MTENILSNIIELIIMNERKKKKRVFSIKKKI